MNAEIEYEQDSWTCAHDALPDGVGHVDRTLKVCLECGSTVYWRPGFFGNWRMVEPYGAARWVGLRAALTNLEVELIHGNDVEWGPSTTARFKPSVNPAREMAWAPTDDEAILLLARSMSWIEWPPVSLSIDLAA